MPRRGLLGAAASVFGFGFQLALEKLNVSGGGPFGQIGKIFSFYAK